MSIKPGLIFQTLAVSLLLLAGCTLPPEKPRPPAVPSEAALRAAALERQGDFEGAARAYRRLAGQAGATEKQGYLLQALALLVRAEAYDQAEGLYPQVDEKALNPQDRLRHRLLGSEILRAQQRWHEVLDRLASPLPAGTPAATATHYYEMRAEAWLRMDQPLESFRERIRLDGLLKDVAARKENQRRILNGLPTLPESTLEAAFGYKDPALDPWLELALITKHYPLDRDRFVADIEQWQQHYPGHPIQPELLDELYAKLQAQSQPPAHIALLLPGTGPFADAAAALRDGFLAAYFTDTSAERPEIQIYDSQLPENIWNTYQSAVADGADFVVGPLDKQAVATLAQGDDLAIPVLALNQVNVPEPLPANLVQFSLSPEDEAQQAAERAWLDGHRRALVLVPKGVWGKRVASAFSQRWQALGGTILGRHVYSAEETDFSHTIRKMMNLDQSEGRWRELKRRLTRDLKYEPTRRKDVDALFLGAYPQEARILWPQLQFHRAGDLPVYSTAQVFSGRWNPDNDHDMDGVQFCDMPWLLTDDAETPLSRKTFEKLWPENPERYLRLYAMGIDAYGALIHLPRLGSDSEQTYLGKTGRLYVDEQRRLRRQLLWAQFAGGIPKVLGFSEPVPLDRRSPASRQRRDRSFLTQSTKNPNTAPPTSTPFPTPFGPSTESR